MTFSLHRPQKLFGDLSLSASHGIFRFRFFVLLVLALFNTSKALYHLFSSLSNPRPLDIPLDILFIDEAYSLLEDRDRLYGDEAINTIVQEMENRREDMVVIFAGYPNEMKDFMLKNPGLRSRVAFNVPFQDYNTEELYQITELLAENRKLMLAPDVKDKLLPIFTRAMEEDDFGNGRFARNLLEKAQMKHASRLIGMDIGSVSNEDVCTLTADDFDTSLLPSFIQKQKIGFSAT